MRNLNKRNREMLSQSHSFLKRIIAGNETQIYAFDTETSKKSREWRLKCEARPNRPRQCRSKIKTILTVFFDCRGAVDYESLPTGQK